MKRKSPERTVRVECEVCGPVSVPLDILHVRCCHENHDDVTYSFRCVYCLRITVHPVRPLVAALLLDHPWISVEWFHVPAEVEERGRQPLRPPLTENDVLDFTRELNSL